MAGGDVQPRFVGVARLEHGLSDLPGPNHGRAVSESASSKVAKKSNTPGGGAGCWLLRAGKERFICVASMRDAQVDGYVCT